MAELTNQRRSQRVPFGQLTTDMEVDGRTYAVRVHDLSQDGMRIVVDSDVEINPDTEIKIGVGKISPNVRARVRWVSARQAGAPLQFGIKFESFLLEHPADDEVEGLLEAWREISHTYSVFESFLHILLELDYQIVDAKLDDLSEVVYSVTRWLDTRVGPLNLWSVPEEPGGSFAPELTVERHSLPPEQEGARRDAVQRAAEERLTCWSDTRAYVFGGDVVIEYLGREEGQVDLLQRLAVLLSKRVGFWSRLFMKNISLQLFGDELERLQRLKT